MKSFLTLLLILGVPLSLHAGQTIVKTMPLNNSITETGIVRLVVKLTDDATGPDIGITLHESDLAAPWDDGMAIMMFDFTKNTNGGIHLAGYNGEASWDWNTNVKTVEKGRQIALFLTVDAANNTHSLAAQMQGETSVTTIYTDYGDRASLKGKPNANAGYCSVFVNNRDGQQSSAVEIIEEATIVSSISPYEFSDSLCFTSYGDIVYADIVTGDTYEFADRLLSTSGIYYDTIMNVQGCDSILTLNLTVAPNSDKAEILAQLQKVSNYYMIQNPETETVNSGASKWLEGSYFNGHMALYDLYPSKEVMRYAMQWGKNNDWNIGDTRGEADNQCVGQVYMDLYYANGAKEDAILAKVGNSVEAMVNRASAISDWDWIDALYMAMPTLVRYGVSTGNDAYFDKLYEMYHNTKVTQQLYNSSDSLWYRDGSVLSGRKYKCYWSRGNGWVFGAHVRTLTYLPESDSHRQEYIDTYKGMAAKLMTLQRTDGFWNSCLDDDTYYPGPETSGTAFFVYGMAWGINNGYLDKDTYLPTVLKGWKALVDSTLDTDGRIGFVQGVADEPKDDQPVTFEKSREYGAGNFLLAGREVIKLVEGNIPLPEHFYVKDVILEDDKLIVYFFEPAEKTSAETLTNYSINKDVKVLSAQLSDDSMSCVLQLSDLEKGGYGISFENIKSASNKTIETTSGQYFYSNLNNTSSSNNLKTEEGYLKVYPNPTNQPFVTIELISKPKGKIGLSLIDTSGKVMISETTRRSKYTLNIQNMDSGIYILTAKGKNFNTNKKLVIN